MGILPRTFGRTGQTALIGVGKLELRRGGQLAQEASSNTSVATASRRNTVAGASE